MLDFFLKRAFAHFLCNPSINDILWVLVFFFWRILWILACRFKIDNLSDTLYMYLMINKYKSQLCNKKN